jgi:ribokinase
MRRLIVLGNATVDLVFHADRLPAPGETRLARAFLRQPGGKGMNQAAAAARTGAATRLVAPLGPDADSAFLRAAAAAEPLEAAWLDVAAPTDLSAIWVAAGGENAILSTAAAAHAVTPDDARAEIARAGAGDLLLLQGNLSAAATRAAAAFAREGGLILVLNPSPLDPGLDAAVRIADLVIANRDEAQALTKSPDPNAAAADLIARGAGAVIVTLGSDGALLAQADMAPVRLPAAPADVVDTAGAGDVVAGVVAGLLAQGAPLASSLAAALKAAAVAVSRPGTLSAFPTAAELAPLVAAALQER